MDKVYDLDLRGGEDGSIGFLCMSVSGFECLWEEFVEDSYKRLGLENFLVNRAGLRYSEGYLAAEDIREEVKSMLPCSMTAKKFEDIVNKHIDKYLEK